MNAKNVLFRELCGKCYITDFLSIYSGTLGGGSLILNSRKVKKTLFESDP